MFRLQLVKCYSHKFILWSSHHPPLTGNDNLCYFSSSSPNNKKLYNILYFLSTTHFYQFVCIFPLCFRFYYVLHRYKSYPMNHLFCISILESKLTIKYLSIRRGIDCNSMQVWINFSLFIHNCLQ